jgi:hypothetical protein
MSEEVVEQDLNVEEVEDEDTTPTNGFGSNEGCSLLQNKNFFRLFIKRRRLADEIGVGIR